MRLQARRLAKKVGTLDFKPFIQRVHYSAHTDTKGRKCVTIYSKDYDRTLGEIFAAGVLALSKVPGLPVEGYRAGLATAPGWVASVKCADIIHNAGDVAEVDPAFARRWLPGKIADLEVLGHADPAIYAEACAVVARAWAVASLAA